MQRIYIEDEDSTIELYIDKNKYDGIVFKNDNTYKTVDDSVFNYLKCFLLSNDYKNLGIENEYNIFIDNITGLKHYFKNKKEDFKMLFLNNGISNVLEKNNSNNKLSKKFDFNINGIKKFAVIASCTAIIGICAYLSESGLDIPFTRTYMQKKEFANELTINEIKNLIYSSPNLTNEEKTYLYNEKLCLDVLPYIRGNIKNAHVLKERLDNLDITDFSPNYDSSKDTLGYVDYTDPNIIHVKNYHENFSEEKDTIAHEIIHLFQANYDRNLIKEACAELISYEYYNTSKISSYCEEVKLVKILMEIIGPDPVWEYNFTGDHYRIDQEVKNYLSEEEFKEFTKLITIYDEDKRDENNIKLENLLITLYKNKYKSDYKEDEAISLVMLNKDICRYYFNSDYINEENSYIEKKEEEILSLEEALKENVVRYVIISGSEITKEEAKEILSTDNSTGKFSNYDTYVIGGTEMGTNDFVPVALEDLESMEYGTIFITCEKSFGYNEYINKEYENYDYLATRIDLLKAATILKKSERIKIVRHNKYYIPPIDKKEINKTILSN